MHCSCSVICALLVCLYLSQAGECHGVDGVFDETSLLQTRQHLTTMAAESKKQEPKCGYLLNGATGDPDTGNCNNVKYHSHAADFSRSIVDVMAEHPGEDGYCYFNMSAMYIYYPSLPDYVASAASGILGLREENYGGLNSGQQVTFNFEGKKITTHADCSHYIYDDLYAYALGFLQGQGLDTSKITNAAEWEALSAEQCDKFQQEYNFTKDELILNDLLDMNLPILAMSYCSTGIPLPESMSFPYAAEKAEYHSAQDCKVITRREFARHHYMKCVLGHKNSGADMSYLHARACLLDGNRIGHFEECPFSPMGMTGRQTDLLLQPALELMWNMTLQAKGLM